MASEAWQEIAKRFAADSDSLYCDGCPVAVLSAEGSVDKWLQPDKADVFESMISALPVEHHGMDEDIQPDQGAVIEFLANFSRAKRAIGAAKEPLLIGMLPPPFPGAPDVPIEVKGGTLEEMREALMKECPDAFVFNDVL